MKLKSEDGVYTIEAILSLTLFMFAFVMKTYRENDILVETIKQFYYDSENEKTAHCKEMEREGYKDSGQVKENVGTVMKPEHVWFGSYYKYESILK